jgi:hypothetical protein
MFHEYKCGCIVSSVQGRVRICTQHVPERTTLDGMGGAMPPKMPGKVRIYPANGMFPAVWNGGK